MRNEGKDGWEKVTYGSLQSDSKVLPPHNILGQIRSSSTTPLSLWINECRDLRNTERATDGIDVPKYRRNG